MRNLLERTGVQGIFRNLPTGLLVLVSMLLVGLAGLDLVLPDPIFLLDEAVLFLLLAGGTSEMARRGRSRRLNRAPAADIDRDEAVREIARAAPELRSLSARASALVEVGRKLVGRGWPADTLRGLRALASGTRRMARELRAHDAFLTRRENDPWQLEVRISQLEREAASLEAGGRARKLEINRKALAVARAHRATVEHRIDEREALLARMGAVSVQVDTLGEDLRRAAAGREIGWRVRELGELDPLVGDVLASVEAAAEAEAEVEEAVRARHDAAIAARHARKAALA